MSYQVLARKWRPYQFNDVVGQSHVLKALCNALEHNRLHHAYLLSGTRGVGKTTIARIFAKGLNCDQGISATPCGQCSSCLEIEQGRCVDLLEIDAASRTKVEDTRELLDNVQYKPARCRYKIYLIDEVHMLSRHSFNALLKTLEEPPEYVKFILATTDPQKLPITILSRCLQFHLKPLSAEQIASQLTHILQQEKVVANPEGLMQIAQAADGSVRDALSLTDQAIALGNGVIEYQQVTEMLGTISSDQALILIEALMRQEAKYLFDALAQLAEIGVDWDGLLKELATQFHRIALAQMLAESLDASLPDAGRILALAGQISPQDIQLFYQIVLQGRQDLPLAANAKSGVEMVLIRLLAFKPAKIVPSPISGNQAFSEHKSVKAQSNNDTEAPKKAQASLAINQPQPALVKESPRAKPSSNAELATQQAPLPKDDALKAELKQENQFSHSVEPMRVNDNQAAQPSFEQDFAPARMNSLVAARNLLRSNKQQRKEAQTTTPENEKLLRDSAQLSAPPFASDMPLSRDDEKKVANPNDAKPAVLQHEAYRWQPSSSISLDEAPSITPKNIKMALGHERTKEMREKLAAQAQREDPWSKTLTELSISQLSKQLALNAAMQKQAFDVILFVRSAQAHLATEKNLIELETALAALLNENITLTIKIDDTEGTTPLEWRDKLYAEKLAQAVESLSADSNIEFIRQRFAAILDKESIRPI